MPDLVSLQLALCREQSAAFSPPAPGSRVGIGPKRGIYIHLVQFYLN